MAAVVDGKALDDTRHMAVETGGLLGSVVAVLGGGGWVLVGAMAIDAGG